MVKKILIVIGLILIFFLGLMSAPQRAVKYDKLNVQGFEYGFSKGTFVLQGGTVEVKRVVAQPNLLFLEEADGTIHLYVKKDEAKLRREITHNQNKRLYSFRCFYYNLFLRLVDFRNAISQSLEDFFGEEDTPEEIITDKG